MTTVKLTEGQIVATAAMKAHATLPYTVDFDDLTLSTEHPAQIAATAAYAADRLKESVAVSGKEALQNTRIARSLKIIEKKLKEAK